jgi:hypothetical protein
VTAPRSGRTGGAAALIEEGLRPLESVPDFDGIKQTPTLPLRRRVTPSRIEILLVVLQSIPNSLIAAGSKATSHREKCRSESFESASQSV